MMVFLLYIAGFIFAVVLISTLIGIPCLPTHRAQARKMIELAAIKPGDMIFDLGAGHGRLLFLAAEAGATAIGYELNPILVLYVRLRAFLYKQKNVQIYCQSLFTADVKNADTVFCFLFPKYMAKLEEKIFSEMKPGAKIIAYVFPFPHKKHVLKTEGVFVYHV